MSSDGSANGRVQVPELNLPRVQLLCPRLGARLHARLRSRTLDRRLARGVGPDRGAALAARAAYLTSRCTRERIADDVERFVAYAERAPSRVTVAPARAAVTANRDELRCLAATLRGPSPVYARGIAELVVLLGDGTGPAYCDRRGDALASRVRRVQTALRG